MSRFAAFLCGTVSGVYIAQSYAVPPIQKVFARVFRAIEHFERDHRKDD